MSIADKRQEAAQRPFSSVRMLFLATAVAIFTSPVLPASASPAVSVPPRIAQFAAWAVGQDGVARGPWAVLDKKNATLYLFDATGSLKAASPVLLGSAVGDDSVPGIGERKISEIRPFERTTPAGTFKTEPGLNTHDEDIVWVDYEAAVSMHRVRALKGERRLEKLATATPKDNRISYGCINVPARFYDRWIAPGFGRHSGTLYVLPETRTSKQQFGGAFAF